MKKFFALFLIPHAVMENWRKTTPPEQMKTASEDMMKAWQKWMKDHEKILADHGGPLGKTKRVTAQNISDARNDLGGYVIVEAESHEAAAKIFVGHPHFMIPEASIEVMEIPSVPGM